MPIFSQILHHFFQLSLGELDSSHLSTKIRTDLQCMVYRRGSPPKQLEILFSLFGKQASMEGCPQKLRSSRTSMSACFLCVKSTFHMSVLTLSGTNQSNFLVQMTYGAIPTQRNLGFSEQNYLYTNAWWVLLSHVLRIYAALRSPIGNLETICYKRTSSSILSQVTGGDSIRMGVVKQTR